MDHLHGNEPSAMRRLPPDGREFGDGDQKKPRIPLEQESLLVKHNNTNTDRRKDAATRVGFVTSHSFSGFGSREHVTSRGALGAGSPVRPWTPRCHSAAENSPRGSDYYWDFSGRKRPQKPMNLVLQRQLYYVFDSCDVIHIDFVSDFAGYDNADWIQTPVLPLDVDLDLSPELIEETLKYFSE